MKREEEEWHITGERAFRPKERSYPHGGGVDATACKGFLGSAERAMHLYDRWAGRLARIYSTCMCMGTEFDLIGAQTLTLTSSNRHLVLEWRVFGMDHNPMLMNVHFGQ